MTSQKQGAFYTGRYRNVFKEHGYSEDDINDRVQKTWKDIFYGDQKTTFYYPVGENKAYILDTGNLDVRTEGMSYGMMMAVQLNKKEEFDRLWTWAREHMYVTFGENAGYFSWSCAPDGTRNYDGPAPDGEEYFALALFFASHRWGDGEHEPYVYSHEAKELLRTCLHKGEDSIGQPMWEKENKLIKFVPNCSFTDPSYHLPHFYELFSLWSYPEDRSFWQEAAHASRRYLQKACHPVTGLAPEYAFYDGSPNHVNGFGHFYSDSYRVAANIGLDYEWFKKDEWQVTEANRIQAFFADKDPLDYRRYTIEGDPFEKKSLHPVGLIATNAMASLAATGPIAKAHVDLFWQTPVRQGERRYYDNCLYLFAMLALSGNYRIWMPQKS
ncbi:glycosyl hydrolase family 8 [Bacillus horti]|uniref:Oligosaccharide reducing-end xylanase n=1 Tax=Caldalkalibacillus horti TaxID=77523 RepID=A0ABT9W2J5_9BACI|nr:glycosyl hydrolase family 8 [Bacillus horti]MDQ0167473.1 oligosaccharide reducing-end xylanase [Bacillus horti]